MLSDAFTWIVLHPFIAGAVLILCLIVLERLTRRKWPWRFKATVTYVCDGDSVWVKRTIGGRLNNPRLKARGFLTRCRLSRNSQGF